MEFKGLGITFICNRCLKEIQIAVDLPISARHPETQFPCNIVYTMRRNHHNCFLCYNCYNFVKQLLHETTNTLSRYPFPKFLHVNPAWHRTGLTHAEYRLRIRKQATDLSYIIYLSSLFMLYVKTSLTDLWNISSPISSDNILFQPTSESNAFISVEMIQHAEEWKPQFKLKSYKCVGDEITHRDRKPQLKLESNDLVSVGIIQNIEECEPHPLQQSSNSFSFNMMPARLESDEDVEVYEPQPKLEFTEVFAVESIENVEECELKPMFEARELISVEMIQNVEECEQQALLHSNNLFTLSMRLEFDEFIPTKKNPRVKECESQPTLESYELVGGEIIENIDDVSSHTIIDPEELISDEIIEDIELYKPQPRVESTEFTAVDSIQNVEDYEQKPTFESSESKLQSYKCVGDEMTQNISERELQLTLELNDLVGVEMTQNIEECEPQPVLQSNEIVGINMIARLESDEFVDVKMNPRESEDVISVEMIENVEQCVSQPKLESKELVAIDITQSDEECKNQTTIESDELISIELMENIEVCESQPELESEEFISVEMYVGEYDTQPKQSNELVSTEENEPQSTLKPDKFINIKMTENVLVYEHQSILESDESVSVEMIQNITQPRSESDEFIDMIQSVEEPTKKSDEFISVEIENTEEYELQLGLESKLVDEDKSNEFISVQIIENPEECESQPTLESSEFVRIEMIQNVEDCELQSKLEIDELDVDVMQNIVTCEPQLTLESDELVTIEMIQNIENCEQPTKESDELNAALDVFPNVPDCESSELDESILNLEECKGQSTPNKLDNEKTIRNNEEGDPQPKMKSEKFASDDMIQNIKEWKTTSTLNEMFPNVDEQATSDSDEYLSVKMLPVIRECKGQPKLRSGESVGVEMINEDYDQSDTDSHRTYVIDFVPHVRRPRVCWEAETLSDEEHDEETIFWAWKRRCPVEHELHRSPARTNLLIPNIETVQPEANEASATLDVQDSPERLWLQDVSYDSENHYTTTLEVSDNQDSRIQLDMLEEPWSPRARIQDWIFTHATTSTNTRKPADSNDWILKNHKFSKFTNINKPPTLMPPISSTSDLALIDISDESS